MKICFRSTPTSDTRRRGIISVCDYVCVLGLDQGVLFVLDFVFSFVCHSKTKGNIEEDELTLGNLQHVVISRR